MSTEPHISSDNLLTIRDLHTYFYTEDGVVKALNGVNLEIQRGKSSAWWGKAAAGNR